ncbi:Wings apart-like protein 1 [Linum grandiflorum]
MIVRTYGRRSSRSSFSDSLDDDGDGDNSFLGGGGRDSFSLSQETPSQSFYDFPFSSQESSSFWSQDDLPPKPRKSKKPRNGKLMEEEGRRGWVPSTSTTLMEAQEYGEMMEHVDEVNFSIDGLRKGLPVRIRRASLLSLLTICGTAQKRRLLRAQGTVKTIVDAVLRLTFDDTPSNLAAATLFYVLNSDGQDDHMLESPSCIRFLLKLLKPIPSVATEDKPRNLGSKLIAIRRGSDILGDTNKVVDSGSSAILAKVDEILVSSKVIQSHCGHYKGLERPELTSKYIALLTMEKACLSKIALEDTSGMVRKMDGNFKEKLRELGGLDAVFEVAMSSYSVIEKLESQRSSSSQSAQDVLLLPSLVMLLKCLKIMENATFLSKENQDHLLMMKRNSDSHGCRISFAKLVISVVKILSGFYLRRSFISADGKSSSLSNGKCKVDSNEVICISSSESDCYITEVIQSERSSGTRLKSAAQQALSVSREATTTAMEDNSLLKMRVRSSLFSSSSQTSRSCNGTVSATSNGSRTNYDLVDLDDSLSDSEDPFAFDDDGDDLVPSKWDVLSGKRKVSRTSAVIKPAKELQRDPYVIELQGESNEQLESSGKDSNLIVPDEECSTLLSECLLTSVKVFHFICYSYVSSCVCTNHGFEALFRVFWQVLMNLTNENPIGCRQVAACRGLETMSSLIADHFPSFGLPSSEDTSGSALEHPNEGRLTDQDLDFLVAILGLLVNLIEKDSQNRSRLASANVSLANSQGSEDDNSRVDVIPLLCSIFKAHRGCGDQSEQGNAIEWGDEEAMLEGEKEAEKMIVEAYAALLLAFLSTESKSTRDSISECLPEQNLSVLVPVLERFVAFHLSLNMISPETHKVVKVVIESCKVP